jgi:phosphoglycerol transferase MdoB-like AlkP superfamily enzyme
MPIDLILLIAALIISWLIFTWLVKIVKLTVGTALTIAGIVLVLQLLFGVNPNQLWQQILNLPQIILYWIAS